MPIIHINILEGRSQEKKDELAARVADTASDILEVKPEAVRILIHEIPEEKWYVGGIPKSAKT